MDGGLGLIFSRISRRVLEMESGKRRDVVYVHMLKYPVYYWLDPKRVEEGQRRAATNPSVLMSYLVHAGALRYVRPAREMCVKLHVNTANVTPHVKRRFIKDSKVTLCGTADAVLLLKGEPAIPIEIKSTRRRVDRPPPEWRLQASIYAYLYASPYAVLAVINLVDGEEYDHVVEPISEKRLKGIVERWLRGEYPSKK